MRLHFLDSERLRKAAKSISELAERPLAQVQEALARCCGFQNWFDFSRNNDATLAFPLDQNIDRQEFIARQTNIALLLASELNLPDGDAQFALSRTHLTGSRPTSLSDQIAIRLECLRRTTLPISGRRQPGAIGRLKTRGRNGEAVILRSYGYAKTSVVTHRGVGSVADFEYITPKIIPPLFMPMRLYIPYGAWTEPDGSKVLFSRDYFPLWRISNGKKPERLNPWLRIRFTHEEWFWDDTTTPWSSSRRFQDMRQSMEAMGIYSLPILTDALPILVNSNDEIQCMRDALPTLRQTRANKVLA
jgi:hypothetical protein